MEQWLTEIAKAGLPGLVFAMLYWSTRAERDIKNETIAQLREDRDEWRKRALKCEGLIL